MIAKVVPDDATITAISEVSPQRLRWSAATVPATSWPNVIPTRVSGTEPLLRVYVEAAAPELVAEILSTAEAFVRDGKS